MKEILTGFLRHINRWNLPLRSGMKLKMVKAPITGSWPTRCRSWSSWVLQKRWRFDITFVLSTSTFILLARFAGRSRFGKMTLYEEDPAPLPVVFYFAHRGFYNQSCLKGSRFLSFGSPLGLRNPGRQCEASGNQ